MTCIEYMGVINLTLGWLWLFYSMVKFPFIGECYNIRRPGNCKRLRYISWYIQGQLSESWQWGGGRLCSNNPDHKMGMIAQRILKVPSLISLGPLEFQCLNILTYLMNVSSMDDTKTVYCPLDLVVNYAPTPNFPIHGETSHVQVKDPVCSVVTLLHGVLQIWFLVL